MSKLDDCPRTTQRPSLWLVRTQGMVVFSFYSADTSKKMDPIEAGSGGFCFVMVELLMLRYPNSQLCRLTSGDRTAFEHVFVCVAGSAVDIGGFRDVVAEARFRFEN